MGRHAAASVAQHQQGTPRTINRAEATRNTGRSASCWSGVRAEDLRIRGELIKLPHVPGVASRLLWSTASVPREDVAPAA